ncbi:transglycosylase domain-containing protein [Thermoactinomyces mirandus]|uniref:Penicillin-binding protein n=1 Tax=Thermoactinomyces mirandus TaxID=2756294 RepID=A0A7W1XR18_9BACL|nr:transglycosylase domain-containing protein [Thermoactinomyces mirandus]MBA4601465.1 penicillin-binding protein [Thermoactinomyces mirandus]
MNKRTKLILTSSLSAVLAITVGVFGVGAGIVSAFAKDEKIRTKEAYEKELNGWSQTSYAYFRPENGEVKPIGRMISQTDRKLIKSMDEVSPYVADALIATEDREFYDHNGIVPRSIARAAWQQIIHSDVETGGSTLTQQLVKNEILDNTKKTYERKTLEIINALRLERFYSKEEIFVKYLNSVEFGPGAHGTRMVGFASAARGLFNKDIKKLNIAQSAYLAGMVQRPYDYNPFYGNTEKEQEKHLKKGIKRMNLVLDKMLETGHITQEQHDQAAKYDIKSSLAKPSDFPNAYENYPYIITSVEREAAQVLREMDEKKGNKVQSYKNYLDEVRQGGYKIYTTIDQKMYDAVNEAVSKIDMPSKNGHSEQIGATIIDNKTGAILAFVGGTSFEKSNINYALSATNQPGSTIKPLLVYGPAMNKGIISPDSVIIDEPVKKAGSSDYYVNANGRYQGPVNATYALQYSLNIPAVKIFKKLGIETGFNYLRKMGMPPTKYDGEASALGGMRAGYTVSEMTAGFAMIANNGQHNPPHLIEKIVDANGQVIYEYDRDQKPKKILKPSVAYELTSMLRKVVTEGTGRFIGASLPGYNIAGKTGTTTNYYDLWFIGYTPEISLGVWTGYSDANRSANQQLSKSAWVKIFKAAAKSRPDLIKQGSSFDNPGGKVETKCFECNKVQQTQPDQPGQPGQQEQPGQPGQPKLPVNPEQPGQPGTEQPEQPGAPAQPQTGNPGVPQ